MWIEWILQGVMLSWFGMGLILIWFGISHHRLQKRVDHIEGVIRSVSPSAAARFERGETRVSLGRQVRPFGEDDDG